jgi:hypothetical protein
MADHSLTTSGLLEVKVKLSGSAVESIAAYLEKRKREGTVDPSANVSVKQALKTRGDDADKVIIKELTQMDVLKVWEAVKAQDMSAAESPRCSSRGRPTRTVALESIRLAW